MAGEQNSAKKQLAGIKEYIFEENEPLLDKGYAVEMGCVQSGGSCCRNINLLGAVEWRRKGRSSGVARKICAIDCQSFEASMAG